MCSFCTRFSNLAIITEIETENTPVIKLNDKMKYIFMIIEIKEIIVNTETAMRLLFLWRFFSFSESGLFLCSIGAKRKIIIEDKTVKIINRYPICWSCRKSVATKKNE